MKIRTVLMTALAATLTFSFADVSHAQGKGNKDKGNKIQVKNKPGKGPKAIPPGQIKRYTRGAKLPSDLNWVSIGDLSKWNLKAPGKGNRYIQVGDDILEVTDDLGTVVDAVGIVGDLLK